MNDKEINEIKNKDLFFNITDDIYMIFQESMKNLNFNSSNSYLIRYEENKFVVIDPGCPVLKFKKALRAMEIPLNQIKHVYLTHAHRDHSILVNFIKRKSNATIHVHERERKYCESVSEYFNYMFDLDILRKYPKYSVIIDCIEHFISPNQTDEVNQAIKTIFDMWNLKEIHVDSTFNDNDILLGDLKVMPFPGHTTGMCGFYQEKAKILFSSDIDFSRRGPVFSSNYVNVKDFKTSLEKVMSMVKGKKISAILPAHWNPVFTNYEEKIYSYGKKIQEKENQIVQILASKQKEMSLEEITDISFLEFSKQFEKYLDGTFPRDSLLIAEAAELMVNHNYLIELERLQKIKKDKSKYWIIK